MRHVLLGALAVLAALSLAGCDRKPSATAEKSASSTGEIRIVRENGDISAVSMVGDCKASLDYRPAEPYTMHLRNECAQTLEDKLNLLGAMVEALFGTAGPAPEMTSLYVGLLGNTFPEIGQRVAYAAADKSDRKLRKALEQGQINRYYMEIAGDSDNYPELQQLFDRWKLDVVGVSVEKVMIGTPAQTPYAGWLVDKGIRPDHTFPYDAQTWSGWLVDKGIRPDHTFPYDAQTWFKLRRQPPSDNEEDVDRKE
jgi:hypothetical protein